MRGEFGAVPAPLGERVDVGAKARHHRVDRDPAQRLVVQAGHVELLAVHAAAPPIEDRLHMQLHM